MSAPRLILNNLTFHFDNTPIAFDDICLSFEAKKYGIVGDNGVGKTTFLKLLCGQISPDGGSIQCDGALLYLPQSYADIALQASIADVLGVSHILAAMHRIQSGNNNADDFDIIDNQWNIQLKIENALVHFNLGNIDIHSPFSLLSGGQKTKILLAKTLIWNADFILMDEPTNNLDKTSRHILYQFIAKTNKGVIIVSHDRALLNTMNTIIEITTKGIRIYGGNYDFYHEEKDIMLLALEKEYEEAKRDIQIASKKIQATREKHQRLAGRGKKAFREGHVDKMTARSKQGRSEKSKKRMTIQEDRIVEKNTKIITDIKEKIESKESITASLDATRVPNGKMVLDIKNLNFHYNHQFIFLIQDFNLTLIGSEKVAITGPNGCGKSTLIKLIRNQLLPTTGSIKIGVEHVTCFDQAVSFLNDNQTLVENFLSHNPSVKVFDAYSSLAEFQFRNKEAEKKVSDLSGGEKMRAGLAISLMSPHPPQLIILDEPTNHLDLRSIEAIESILRDYQGAIMAVSHDEQFLKNIGIIKTIKLDTI